MAVHLTNVVVLRLGEVVDRISRPPRRLPEGSIGVEYLGLVYPIHRAGQIDADGAWYYPAQAPICLEAPESPVEPGAAASWFLDAGGTRPYLFLNGSEAVLHEALRLLLEAGFRPERWGPSFREGEEGYLFDWFIRFPHTDDGPPPTAWELEQLFLAARSRGQANAEKAEASDALAQERLSRDRSRLADRVIALERELAIEIGRRDAAQAGAAELKRSFERELKRAREATAFLRAALNQTKSRADVVQPPPEDSAGLTAALAAARSDVENALHQWLASEEALQEANNELAGARGRVAELEVALAHPSRSAGSLTGRTRGGLRELEATLAVFAPTIVLMRDSAHFITVEVADRTDLYTKLRSLHDAPQTVRSKRVHAADGWLELHFSTGLARDGRMYFKQLEVDGQTRWSVLVSDKGGQPRDFAWIAAQ